MKIPVGVIGVGHMGRLHARAYARCDRAVLAGVVDLDLERARAVALELGTSALDDLGALAERCRAVSVAVPTAAHAAVASALIERGVDVLVEKPLAATAAAARDLVRLAALKKTVLMAGHSERFNPVVRAMGSLLRAPGFIEAHRLAPFNDRGTDVDVVLDLMVHDLDLILHFVRSEVEAIDAVGVPVLTAGADIVSARIRFRSGTVANLTASRISAEPTRKIRFFEQDLYVSLDTARRVAHAYRLVRGEARPRIEQLSLDTPPQDEPIDAEVKAFLDAVETRAEPEVSGAQALAVVELAEGVKAAIDAHGRR